MRLISKSTVPPWEYTRSQYRKWVKEGNLLLITKTQSWVCTNMSIQKQLTCCEGTRSQYSKWAKGGKLWSWLTKFITHHKVDLCVQKHVHSRATYHLIVEQFTVRKWGRRKKCDCHKPNHYSSYSSHKLNHECAHTCPLKGNLHAGSVSDYSRKIR